MKIIHSVVENAVSCILTICENKQRVYRYSRADRNPTLAAPTLGESGRFCKSKLIMIINQKTKATLTVEDIVNHNRLHVGLMSRKLSNGEKQDLEGAHFIVTTCLIPLCVCCHRLF